MIRHFWICLQFMTILWTRSTVIVDRLLNWFRLASLSRRRLAISIFIFSNISHALSCFRLHYTFELKRIEKWKIPKKTISNRTHHHDRGQFFLLCFAVFLLCTRRSVHFVKFDILLAPPGAAQCNAYLHVIHPQRFEMEQSKKQSLEIRLTFEFCSVFTWCLSPRLDPDIVHRHCYMQHCGELSIG